MELKWGIFTSKTCILSALRHSPLNSWPLSWASSLFHATSLVKALLSHRQGWWQWAQGTGPLASRNRVVLWNSKIMCKSSFLWVFLFPLLLDLLLDWLLLISSRPMQIAVPDSGHLPTTLGTILLPKRSSSSLDKLYPKAFTSASNNWATGSWGRFSLSSSPFVIMA